mgnify:CR=1 FL=1
MNSYYCYIIKITKNNKLRGFKIGERGDTDRVENLIKKYEEDKKNVKAEVLISNIPLPHNREKRLNDKAVHKQLIKEKKFIKQESDTLKEITSENDGKGEFFRLRDRVKMTDFEIVSYVEEVIDKLGKDESNFKTKLKNPKNIIISYRGQQNHVVRNYYINKILEYIPNVYNTIYQSFLLVGQFDEQFVSQLSGYNKVYILYDSEEQKIKYIDAVEKNLYYFYSTDEVLKMCKKFDYIIANPPYAMGNELTKTVVENVEFGKYINLMPASKYKGKELYKYVESIEKVEDNFEDACIGDSLTVATMSKTADAFSSFEELEICKFDERFRKFYELNLSRKSLFNIGPYCSKPTKQKYSQQTDFFVYLRAAVNGVDMSGGTFEWNNNLRSEQELMPYILRTYEDRGQMVYGQFIFFNTPAEKNNFTEFWYRKSGNELMNKFLRGLNKAGGSIELAIPRVDWSHPWTDEEILKEYGYTEEEIKEILE